ncbi:hypothetical protein LSCM1_05005 [Leishmania martiniquensis]|uniref:Transmembrane protein n=1 Tax=Leishmania martiniquensis TaxID=1580590 RepID=A0A836KJ30_9TRYP|nr:hypothetical protein LSCM1_05005 [Leishmania martiniquensis]
MLKLASRGPHGRAFSHAKSMLSLLGAVSATVILIIVGYMLASSPIVSEEEEIITRAYTRALRETREEWVDPDTRHAKRPHAVVVDKDQLLRLYRLRVFVVVTEAEVPKLGGLLKSLINSNYSQRVFPIDISVHVLGSASALPFVLWSHGRFDVYAHHLHGNALPSMSLMMADVWQPQSDFELGLLLTASARVSPHWFQWVFSALRQYAPTSTEAAFRLAAREISGTEQVQLLSPLSRTLSGFALGLPVAGTAASAVSSVFATQPSITSIFTASFWKAVLARAGPDANADTAPESWKALLRLTTTKLGGEHRFLYPPLAKFGALACEETARCSIRTLTAAQLTEMMSLPAFVDQIPRAQV